MSFRSNTTFMLLTLQIGLGAAACDAPVSADAPLTASRGPVGKADRFEGSCTDHCGGAAKHGVCWCDGWCAEYGDCCEDAAVECGVDTCTTDESCAVDQTCTEHPDWGARVCQEVEPVPTCGNGIVDEDEACDPAAPAGACGPSRLPCNDSCELEGDLQQRIDAACDGDELCLGPELIEANVVVTDKTVTLRGDCGGTLTGWTCPDDSRRAIIAGIGSDITVIGFEFFGCGNGVQASVPGGVVLLDGTDAVRLRDSVFHDNASHRGPVVSSYRGDGISELGLVELRNNIMVDNHANDAGVVYVATATNIVMVNNLIYGNRADDYSAAVWLRYQDRDDLVFERNVVFDNRADRAAALAVHSGDGPLIVDSIVSSNRPVDRDSAWPTSYSRIGGSNTFVDAAAGDFRLRQGSPDIDAGDPSSPLDPNGSRADRGIIWEHLPQW